MDIEVRHLRLLAAVAEARSVSEASRRLQMSQPAVSNAVARIEAALGARVFVRSARGVQLTDFGAGALPRIHELLALYDEVVGALSDSAARPRPFRVGGNAGVLFGDFVAQASRVLPRPLQPKSDTSSAVLTDWLTEGALDLASVGVHPAFDDEVPPGLAQWVYVEKEPFLIALSSADPRARQEDVSIAELGDVDWLLPPGPPDGTMSALTHSFEQAGVRPRTSLGRADVEEHAAWIASGLGVAAVLPTWAPPEGVTVVPVRDAALHGQHVIRWSPERVTDAEVQRCRAVFAETYLARLERVGGKQSWWHRSPRYRPLMHADFTESGRSGV